MYNRLQLANFLHLLFVTAALIVVMNSTTLAQSKLFRVYIGTYTNGDSQGIYLSELDTETGILAPPQLVAETENPSFLALTPTASYLYAVNETTDFKGEAAGSVSAYAVDSKSGKLTFLNQQSTKGGAPCHLVIDNAAKNVLVANYVGGNVVCLPIHSDGSLQSTSSVIQHHGSSVNAGRQEAPHAHSINLDPQNRFAFAADLGLDKILVYRFDADLGTLTAHEPFGIAVTPGAGPRHFAIHPNGQFAYVINEMQLTVDAFAYDSKAGVLASIQTISTVPENTSGDNLSTAEIQVHPSGKFLYGSNRGHNTIVAYRIDPQNGTLSYIENQSTAGQTPRNFAIDPTGNYLLAENQTTNTIVVLRIDPETGKLEPTGNSVKVPSPVCVKMIPR